MNFEKIKKKGKTIQPPPSSFPQLVSEPRRSNFQNKWFLKLSTIHVSN